MKANRLPTRMRQISFKYLAAVMTTVFVYMVNVSVAQAVNLTDIVYSKLSGDDVQINIVADGPLEEPGSFSTDTPARIALDFFGMKSQLAAAQTLVEAGKVKSIVAAETSDRTRIIVNLYESARYSINESENGYSIIVFQQNSDVSAVVSPKPFAKRADVTPDTEVSNIDFRRSEAGGGTLIIDLDDDNFAVDTREQNGEIVVDLIGVTLPSEFEQSLDVTDFATPVKKVDSFQNSDNVRLVVVPQGKYQHLSFQSGGRFTLIVDPVIETIEDSRNQEDLALGYEGERLSINFQNIEVRSALAVIADFTGINFVTSDAVDGEITINLKDVPWDQALDVILRTRGLAKRKTGNVIWIAPSDEIIEFEEAELKASAVIDELAPLVTEIIQINYAKAEDIARVIQEAKQNSEQSQSQSVAGLLGGSETTSTETQTTEGGNSLLGKRGSVTVDVRTNSLLVQDVPSKIVSLRNVVAKLDKPVRQVLIETRIVEASDNFSRELGARLGFQQVAPNASFPGSNSSNIGNVFGSGTIAGGTSLIESFNEQQEAIFENLISDEPSFVPGLEFDVSTGAPGGLAVDLGADVIGGENPASYAFNIFRTTSAGISSLLTLELSALEADGRGKIVASPRLMTANQREARISQGQEVFVNVPGSGLSGGSLERIDAELELIVTPQITPDDRIILDVEIQQDVLVQASQGVSTVGTKEIITQVLADNGETIVIGGIYQESESHNETKVPVLGDVPVLRNLFRKKSRESTKTELLIFLTPKIISPKLNLG